MPGLRGNMKLITIFCCGFLKTKPLKNNKAMDPSQKRILIYSLCNSKSICSNNLLMALKIYLYWGPLSPLIIWGINNTKCSSSFLKENKWRGKNGIRLVTVIILFYLPVVRNIAPGRRQNNCNKRV